MPATANSYIADLYSNFMKLQKKPALDRHFLVPIVPKWCAAGVRRARIVAIQRDSAMAERKNLLLPACPVLPK